MPNPKKLQVVKGNKKLGAWTRDVYQVDEITPFEDGAKLALSKLRGQSTSKPKLTLWVRYMKHLGNDEFNASKGDGINKIKFKVLKRAGAVKTEGVRALTQELKSIIEAKFKPGDKVRVAKSHGSASMRGDTGTIEKAIQFNKYRVKLRKSGSSVVDREDLELMESTNALMESTNARELKRAAQLAESAAKDLDKAVRAAIQAGLPGMSNAAKLLEQARDKAEYAYVELERLRKA